MTRTVLWALLGLGVGYGIYSIRKYAKREYVSDAWLNEQERADTRMETEFDGPAWKWPVRKLADE